MITPADIKKFTSGVNARFITNMDAGKIAIRDQFKVIMGLSSEIKERLFAPTLVNSDVYFESMSFMFDQITEFLEHVIAEMSDDDDEDDAAAGIDPQVLQLNNALDEVYSYTLPTPSYLLIDENFSWSKESRKIFSPNSARESTKQRRYIPSLTLLFSLTP